MNDKLVSPCGTYCGTCTFLNKKDPPTCSGCGNQKGRPFWGECKLYDCATRKVEHCGVCKDFPCDLFVNQFDPSAGQKSSFTRAGLLAYRKRAGTEKFIEMSKKLDEKHPQRTNKDNTSSSTMKYARLKRLQHTKTQTARAKPAKQNHTKTFSQPSARKNLGGRGVEKANKTR